MNKQIETMKNAVTNYHKTVKAAVAKMNENTRLYKPEEAKKANAAIMAQLDKDREAVKGLIAEAKEAGINAADTWGKLDGSKITDDAKLLDAGMVNPDQFRCLVAKYKDNATMLQLLSNYAEKKNADSGSFSAVWNWGGKGNAARNVQHFDTTGIPTVQKRKDTISVYADAASDLADRIGDLQKGKIGTGPDSPFILDTLQRFGQDVDI